VLVVVLVVLLVLLLVVVVVLLLLLLLLLLELLRVFSLHGFFLLVLVLARIETLLLLRGTSFVYHFGDGDILDSHAGQITNSCPVVVLRLKEWIVRSDWLT
jgi:hypothetical protein